MELVNLQVELPDLLLAPPILGLLLHLATTTVPSSLSHHYRTSRLQATRTVPSSLSLHYRTSNSRATRTALSLHSHLYRTSRLRATRTVPSSLSHKQLQAIRTAPSSVSHLYQTHSHPIRTAPTSLSHLYRTSSHLASRTAPSSVSHFYRTSSGTSQLKLASHLLPNSWSLKPHLHLPHLNLMPWLPCRGMCPRLLTPPHFLLWLLPMIPRGLLPDCPLSFLMIAPSSSNLR